MNVSDLELNFAEVRAEIEAARAAAGREDEVLLLAAAKSATPEQLCYAHEKLGLTDIGENRVNQLLERWPLLPRSLRVHFIGSLQTNKVKYIIDKVCMIHSLDNERLAAEIERQAAKRDLTMDVLVEINSGREESKGGILPEDAADFCRALSAYPHINLRGFMTMAPKCEKKEDFLKYFAETSSLALDIWQKKLDNINRPVLSMGMSDSFSAAIACGSTVVRVGRRLFAARGEN
ncbi:MAG: YggS family pyridoxal phosphate-dependent enzyme [Clostridia bacterium]|nr:YggS family pyridoxal phosphate-dependent enzyme [Clostridia bacterium]